MLEAFCDYTGWRSSCCRKAASHRPHTPQVLSSRSRELARITDEAASEAIKAIFADAARRRCPAGRRHGGDAVPQHGHQAREQRVQLKTLQDTAGHANFATSATDLRKTDNARYDEIIGSVNGKGIM